VCVCACKLRCNSRLAAAAFALSVERGRVTALAPLPSLFVSCVPCRHSADLRPVAKGTKSRSARPGASIMACAAFLAARMASRAALVLPHVLGAPVRAYPRFLCSPPHHHHHRPLSRYLSRQASNPLENAHMGGETLRENGFARVFVCGFCVAQGRGQGRYHRAVHMLLLV
jgi:hypothetical protein